MNWYKRAATRVIHVPEKDYDNLMLLIDKMAQGYRNWSNEELQLQQNYPEAVEVLLKQKISKKAFRIT